MNRVLETYLLLFFQYANGDMVRGDMNDAIVGYYKHNLGVKKYRTEKEKNKKDFWFNIYYERIPLSNCWEQMIFDCNFNINSITKNLESDFRKNEPTQLSNLFYILNHWKDMASDEFKVRVEKLLDEFTNSIYKHPGEILHITNILLMFSKYELIPQSISDISSFISNTLEKISNEVTPLSDFDNVFDSYGGWGYSNNISEFTDIKKNVLSISKYNQEKKNKKSIEEEIEKLDVNFDSFIKDLLYVNGTYKYHDIPVISWMEINKFFQKLLELDFDQQMRFIYTLNERYGLKYTNGVFKKEFYPDYENILKLKELYQSIYTSHKIHYNPIMIKYKALIEEYDKLIEYIENQMQ